MARCILRSVIFTMITFCAVSNAYADDTWEKVIKFLSGRCVNENVVCDSDGENCSSVWMDYQDGIHRIAINRADEKVICIQKYSGNQRACWDLSSKIRTDESLEVALKKWMIKKSRKLDSGEAILHDSDLYFKWLQQNQEKLSLDDSVRIALTWNADSPPKELLEQTMYPRVR